MNTRLRYYEINIVDFKFVDLCTETRLLYLENWLIPNFFLILKFRKTYGELDAFL